MLYSLTSIIALILNHIINHDIFKNMSVRPAERKLDHRAAVRFGFFLVAANFYFIADIFWGVLCEYHNVEALFPLLYIDCVLYFLGMFLTLLAWMRYVVAYLDKSGRRTSILLYGIWTMFTLGLVFLCVNFFFPFFFSFNEAHEYIPGSGRHIAFIMQVALYMVTTSYMLYIARKSKGTDKRRYTAVGLTCLVIELFLLLQTLDHSYPFYAMGLTVGICVAHAFVEAGERKEKEIYDSIASSLAEDYEAMYYINIETGNFREFSTSNLYRSMEVPVTGKDFYAETHDNIEKYVHPDDRDFAYSLYTKETMLEKLKDGKSFSCKYRLMVGGNPRYFRFTLIRAKDDKHIVLYEKDIEDEVIAENTRLEKLKEQVTFSRIAESLASNYDVIYYVDAEDSSFISYQCNNIYGKLDMNRTGKDFFAENRVDIPNIVHKDDREMVLGFLEKDCIAGSLKAHRSCSIDYRIMEGKKTHYVRLTARKTADGTHYIIGIENVDAEARKEKQHLKALNTEKELARRDELTGVRNKTAYNELERAIQENMDSGTEQVPFALVVCDANDLKRVNDTEGHTAGDEYIKASAKLLCEIFDHSPVFRVGGDEFVVFLRGNDYSNREKLMKMLRDRALENTRLGTGPVLASGMSEHDPGGDRSVSDIFSRADKKMYNNKQMLKGIA